jgi:hypothetical protein
LFFRTGGNGNTILLTVAAGDDYFDRWSSASLPSWQRFAEQHDYQIMALRKSQVASDAHLGWNKFAVLGLLENEVSSDANLVVLDADQVFSPIAPSLGDVFSSQQIGVVPQLFGLDRKHLSFLRKAHLSVDYPLDSSILATPGSFKNIPGFEDLSSVRFYSAGFFTVPPSKRAELIDFASWGPADPVSLLDGGGDQMPFLKFLATQKVLQLDNKWQGIWPEILAARYSFLFARRDRDIAVYALASALAEFHCIHFSTTWPEKDFWGLDVLAAWDRIYPALEDFDTNLIDYLNSDVTPKLYGQIERPNNFFA